MRIKDMMKMLVSVPKLLVFSLLSLFITLLFVVILVLASPSSRVSSHYNHQNLLGSTLYLAVEVISGNPLFKFLMCNVLILIILLGSSRPVPSCGELGCSDHGRYQSSTMLFPCSVDQDVDFETEEDECEFISNCDHCTHPAAYEADDDGNIGADIITIEVDRVGKDNNCTKKGEYDGKEEEYCECGDEDNLKIRVEEFIAKINNGWRDEWIRERQYSMNYKYRLLNN